MVIIIAVFFYMIILFDVKNIVRKLFQYLIKKSTLIYIFHFTLQKNLFVEENYFLNGIEAKVHASFPTNILKTKISLPNCRKI